MPTLAGLNGASMVPDTLGMLERGQQFGQNFASNAVTPQLIAQIEAGGPDAQAALTQLTTLNPEAAQNLFALQGQQRNQKIEQQKQVITEERTTAIKRKGNIQKAMMGGPAALRNNLAKIAGELAEDPDFDANEIATLSNLAITDPDAALAQLQGELDSTLAEISIADQMLGGKSPDGFTLGEGQQRFDSAGNLIASGAPKPTPPPKRNTATVDGKVIDTDTGEVIYESTSSGTPDFKKLMPGASPESIRLAENTFESLGGKPENIESAISAGGRLETKTAADQEAVDTLASQAFGAQTGIDAVQSLLKDGAYKAIYGGFDRFSPTVTSASRTSEAKRDQIVGLLTLENRQKLKGQGTISDVESKMLGQSATILADPGISEAAAKRELNKVNTIFNNAKRKALRNPKAELIFKSMVEEERIANDPMAGKVDRVKFLGFE